MKKRGMDRSGVPWADYRWNPIVGCSPASEGCEHCYAAAMARRFRHPWGKPQFVPERLEEPLFTRIPGRVFVCSTSDMFHPDKENWKAPVKDEALRAMWRVMELASQHTFIILTKRPNIMATYVHMFHELPNVWLGVTAENQVRFNERWPVLEKIAAVKRFVSVEPMLGPVELGPARPDWVICGPENGAGKRPCEMLWMANLEETCSERGISYFDKREDGFQSWPDEDMYA